MPQGLCKVYPKLLMVSLSNHEWLNPASFDKLRMDEWTTMDGATLKWPCVMPIALGLERLACGIIVTLYCMNSFRE